MKAPKYEDLNSNNCREKIIKINYPEFYNYLNQRFTANKFTEKLYLYYNGLDTPPMCEVCGGEVAFVNMKGGYRKFCSVKCQGKSQDIRDKKMHTSLKHYGTTNPMKNQVVREKLKDIFKQKYGKENPFQVEEVKNKIKETNLKKYGVESPLKNPEIVSKIRKTNLEKYGVDWVVKTDEVKNKLKHVKDGAILKMKATQKRKFLETHPWVIDYDEFDFICRCAHPECTYCKERTFTIPKYIYHSRKPTGVELCTKLLPLDPHHISNTRPEIFIKSILDKYNIKYIENDRKILSPQELDIVIPDKGIAIECNGCFWHSSIFKAKNYHYNKYKRCLENGYQLLTIWEDWILNFPERVESLLLSKLNIYSTKIGARQCKIRPITREETFELLNEYHIQGNVYSRINYGLFHNNELVEVMSFGKVRKSMGNREDCWELVRLCTKGGFVIVGGASKLLSQFIKDYKPSKIISFSSHDISNGNVYEKLGFKKEGESKTSYWYIDKNFKRYHRYNFTKYQLIKDGYDRSKTEEQIMNDRRYWRIYDSGQSKYILNL